VASKFALIIANTEYSDPGLAQLTSPGMDAREFGRVLDSPELGGFNDVIILFNESSARVGETIDYFFSGRKSDDLLLLYFSGHGVRDEFGALYLAVRNTNRERLRSTAIKSDFIREAMDQSRSRRQILILDCCNSGAFAQGTKAEIGGSIGTAQAFEGTGYGRIVLTASDSTQFAWEGDKVIGQDITNSLFTHFLVKGIEGEADRNGDGKITVDELYDFAYERVVEQTPKQTPGKWSYKQQGDILLRENLKPREVRPAPLPDDILDLLTHQNLSVRKMGIRDLSSLLDGKHLGLTRAAEEKLREIVQNDDSFSLRQTAFELLLARGFAVEPPAPPALTTESSSTNEEVNRLAESEIASSSQPTPLPASNRVNRFPLRLIGWVVGGLLVMSLLAWGGTRLLQNPPAVTTEPTSATQGNVNLLSQASPTVTSQPQETLAPAITETSVPAPAIPALGIGSTMTSDKDGMILLYVPAGKFIMGNHAEDAFAVCSGIRSDCQLDAFADEAPPHEVDLPAFWIDQTEVTNKMYAGCVLDGKCSQPSDTSHFASSNYANHPVVYVSWNDAKSYCDWRGLRLPTEAEWEKAAGGTDQRVFPWGNDLPSNNLANFNGQVGDTTEVGRYPGGVSPYGALDMAGNVWEWVADWYDETYYQKSPSSNPLGPDSGEWRVYRGGSWYNFPDVVRSAVRGAEPPNTFKNSIGFRCAMSAVP